MVSQFISKTRPMYKTISPSFIKTLFQYLNPQAAINAHFWQMAGWVVAALLLLWGIWRLRDQQLSLKPFNPPMPGRRLKSGLLTGYALIVVVMIYGAAHFTLTTTLPLLTRQLAENAPAIYADSIKPYHVQQLATLQYAFIATAVLGGLALIAFYKIDALSESRNVLTDQKTPGLSLPLFFILHLVLPLLLAGLVSLKSPYLLLRNLVIILPFYLLVIAYTIAGQGQSRYLWLSMPLLFLSSLSIKHYEEWYKKDDWRSLAQVLQSQVHPGDVILLDHLFGQKPLYYYGLESQRPLRRKEVNDYFNKLSGDLWVVRSYKNDWCVVDSTDRYFIKTGEWSFPGSTNPDDLFPIEGLLKLYRYRHPATTQTKLVELANPSSHLLPAAMSPSLNAISGPSKHKSLFK
jgi:cytochrome b561